MFQNNIALIYLRVFHYRYNEVMGVVVARVRGGGLEGSVNSPSLFQLCFED